MCKMCNSGVEYRLKNASMREGDAQTVCQYCRGCTDRATYESSACLPWQDRVCTLCKAACSAGQYITSGCNVTANTQCGGCRTQCEAGKYRSTPQQCVGTDVVDVVLASCRSCLTVDQCVPGATYLTGNCTAGVSSSNACAGCTEKTACVAGFYNGGCGGYMDTHCVAYRTCAAKGEYLNGQGETTDGVCVKCRDCTAEGKQTITNCSRYANTACGGELCGEATACSVSTSNFCDYLTTPSTPTCGVCPVSIGAHPFVFTLWV